MELVFVALNLVFLLLKAVAVGAGLVLGAGGVIKLADKVLQ